MKRRYVYIKPKVSVKISACDSFETLSDSEQQVVSFFYDSFRLPWLSILPNLSSPKFPHPIFFPTLKFGPTINTPELPEPDWRLDPCMLDLPDDFRLELSSALSWPLLCISRNLLDQKDPIKRTKYRLFPQRSFFEHLTCLLFMFCHYHMVQICDKKIPINKIKSPVPYTTFKFHFHYGLTFVSSWIFALHV